MDEAREQVLYGLGQCHILKISDNEIQWLTGKNEMIAPACFAIATAFFVALRTFSCVLHYICKHGLENLTEKNLKEMLTYANAAASIITTRKGALRVMPRPEEIEALIAGHH